MPTMASSPRSESLDQHNSDPEKHQSDSEVTNAGHKSSATDAERAVSDAEKKAPSEQIQWLSGLKLWLVMMPLCFAFFLVLLDISIIATVSLQYKTSRKPLDADRSI